MSAKDFESIGVPMPRRTFLDSRGGAQNAYGSGGATAPRAPHGAPKTNRPSTRGGGGSGGGSGDAGGEHVHLGNDGAVKGAAQDTKAVILGEHKVELLDMLQEAMALLRNVYRSKMTLGETLKFVDASYAGDAVGQFNLATPPVFDAAYNIPNPAAEEAEAEAAARAAVGRAAGGGGAGGGADDATKERLRTAEELIKKLYRRNTQLEIENKYVRSEIAKLERLQGLSRTKSHDLNVTDGHVPLDHPLYTPKLRRNCRSVPPQRTMLRSAVGGHGLTFPQRAGQRDEPQSKEDPLPVAQLKKRVLQLTEALVSVQHDNEVLQREREERVGAREALLRKYFSERDQQIAALKSLLTELIGKVNNPMKLARAKQPALSINPVVAHMNVIREVSHRLADQISALSGEIVKTSTGALPPAGTDGSSSPTRNPNASVAGTVDGGDGTHLPAGGETREAGARRKELSKRLRAVVDTLPIVKRKQLLLLLTELRELYQTLVLNNQTLVQSFDAYKARTNSELVQLKMQTALLRDQLRSLGAAEDVLMQTAVQGVGQRQAQGHAGAAAGAAMDP